jgi:hypothetical protein
MCHIIDQCTCVSFGLQDTSDTSIPALTTGHQLGSDDVKAVFDPSRVDTDNQFMNIQHNVLPPVVDQDIWNVVMGDIDTICGGRSQLS